MLAVQNALGSMTMPARLVLITTIALSLSGCLGLEQTFRPYLRPPALVAYSFAPPADVAYQPLMVGDDFLSTGPNSAPTIYVNQISYYSDAENKEYRNLLQNALIDRSDRLCELYLDDMYIRNSARKFTLNEIAQVSTLVSTFAGNPIKDSLTLAANIANATNATMDSDLLKDQLIQLIANQIKSNRNAIFVQIRTNQFEDGTISSLERYPFSTALSDVHRYHTACAFLTGLKSVEQNTTEATRNAAEGIGNPTVAASKK